MSSREADDGAVVTIASPNFEAGGFSSGGDMTTGNPMAVVFSFFNHSGPSEGLTVALGGSAIDEQLVRVDRVGLSYGGQTARRWFEPAFDREQKTYVVTADDFVMRPDMGGIGARLAFAPEQERQWLHHVLSGTLEVELQGEFLAPGDGELIAAVAPHADPEVEPCSSRNAIRVHRMPRIPKHWPPGHPVPAELRLLETPDKLFALVALGADVHDASGLAVDAIERWHGFIRELGIGDIELDIWADPERNPWKVRVIPESIPDDPFWRRVRSSLLLSQKFTGVRPSERYGCCGPLSGWAKTRAFYDFSPRDAEVPFHGFSFSHERIAFGSTAEKSVPHLGLWCDIKGMFDQQVLKLEEQLVGVVSELCRETDAYQAVVGRWRFTPRRRLDKTPYEAAFGIDGGCTVAPSWVRRYLRGVAENLWLGKDLLAYLQDRTQLAKLAEISEFDNGSWIRVKSREQLGELEAALQPVLPSRRDWEQVLRGMG